MKTILIPIFHGHIARNILRTKVLYYLSKEARIVLIVPESKKESYEKEFGNEQVIVVSSPTINHKFFDKFFRFFYYYFVDTETIKIMQQEQFILSKRPIRYFFARLITKFFGNIRISRQIIRQLDKIFVRNNVFVKIFDLYKPDLVFIPSMTSDDEGCVLRESKKRKIPSVGMLRSWDALTVNKGNIRIFSDKLLVHNDLLKADAVKFADYPAKNIEIVGMSHFDYYVNEKRIPRIEFFNSIGGDPNKKTIYFMPIGLSDQNEDTYILKLLEKLIKNSADLTGVQLMTSSHPNSTKQIDYASPETVVIRFPSDDVDLPSKLSDREISKKQMELMASGIYHSDVVVNYQGTSSIDSAAFDKPVINICFESDPKISFLKSVRRFYDFTHYQSILKSGGVRLAKTPEELEVLIKEYINNPKIDHEGRLKILREQNGGALDGNASKRTAKAVLSVII